MDSAKRRSWWLPAGLALGAHLVGCRADEPLAMAASIAPAIPTIDAPAPRETLALVPEFPRATAGPFPFGAQDLLPWRAHVPSIEVVSIVSSVDRRLQSALFHRASGDAPRPLLVVLHSWSESYLQNLGIPYALFAARNGWALIHPDHRGPYRTPAATVSALAQQDVLDAIEDAKRRAPVDEARIFVAGYSGGAMTALVLAAKHPHLFAGVVAWGPIYDLVDWHEWLRARAPERHWARDIAASCGGRPDPGTPAAEECRRRSPSSWLSDARGDVDVFLAAGIWDHLVPPEHAMRAFDDLAAPDDRFSDRDLASVHDSSRPVAPGLDSFGAAGIKVVLSRTSERATIVLFEGGHDVVYNAGLAWLAGKRRAD